MAPKKKSISKRRLRSRVPCSPLLYSYSHSSVHGGMLHAGVLVLLLCDLPCDLSVWWWWWWLEFRVIYVCHLDRDPTVIFILFGHRSQPRSLVGHQQVIFLRVLFLFSRARFESIYQCHIKPLNGNGLLQLNQVNVLDQFDLFHFLVAFIYLLPNPCLIHFFADIDARHWNFHNVAIRQWDLYITWWTISDGFVLFLRDRL